MVMYLRICSGDLAKKPMTDMNLNQYVWLGLAVLMLIPILMVFSEPGNAPACESLGEYYRGRFLFPVQPGWSAYLFIIMGQVPDCSQYGIQCGHDFVCVELELSRIINSCPCPY